MSIINAVLNHYHIHDAKTLAELVTEPVDLVVSSPPYFDMKDYGTAGQIGFGQRYDKYLNDMKTVFAQCHKVVRSTGSMWLIVDTLKRDGGLLPLPFELVDAATKSGWRLQEVVIWKKDRTLPFSARGEMRNIFEYVLFLVRDDSFKFYPDRVTTYDFKRWWVKYPERYSTKGKALTDVWEFPIPVQGSWGNQYVRHFCPLPEELVLRIVDLCSDEGDTVLDPFAGSGAVLAAAYRAHRNYIGLDINPEFKSMFEKHVRTLTKRNPDTDRSNEATVVAGAIRKLRLLKLPSALLKTLRRDSPEMFEAIDGVLVRPTDRECHEPHKLWSVEYVFFTRIPNAELVKEVDRLLQRPPLSKYGVEARAVFEHESPEQPAERIWTYRWDATHLPPEPADDSGPFIAATFRLTDSEAALVLKFR